MSVLSCLINHLTKFIKRQLLYLETTWWWPSTVQYHELRPAASRQYKELPVRKTPPMDPVWRETDECVERHRTYPYIADVYFRLLLLLLDMIITIMSVVKVTINDRAVNE